MDLSGSFLFPGPLLDELFNFPRPVPDALFLPRTCFPARSAEYIVFARFWEHFRGWFSSFGDQLLCSREHFPMNLSESFLFRSDAAKAFDEPPLQIGPKSTPVMGRRRSQGSSAVEGGLSLTFAPVCALRMTAKIKQLWKTRVGGPPIVLAKRSGGRHHPEKRR